jgi:hypothetical protein
MVTTSKRSNRYFSYARRVLATAAGAGFLAIACSAPAAAEMGPCKTAAPSTRQVHLLVNDVDRSSRWYQDNVGLVEERHGFDPDFGATVVQLGRGQAGLTLVSAPHQRGGFGEPQMACFVLEGPPAQPVWYGARYLVDPDGTSVELEP